MVSNMVRLQTRPVLKASSPTALRASTPMAEFLSSDSRKAGWASDKGLGLGAEFSAPHRCPFFVSRCPSESALSFGALRKLSGTT